MSGIIGIRKEDKDISERRAPINPSLVRKIIEQHNLTVKVEPAENRIFTDEEYKDAGAIVTNDEELASKCRMIGNHGRVKKYDHDFEGVNSRLDGLQAAILSVKLKHLEHWTGRRREVADSYSDHLQHSEVIIPVEADGVKHVYHLYVVRVPRRGTVQAALKKKGINTGIHYPIALPNLKAYKYLGYRPQDFPIATQCSKEILSLPIYPELSRSQIEYICKQLLDAVKY